MALFASINSHFPKASPASHFSNQFPAALPNLGKERRRRAISAKIAIPSTTAVAHRKNRRGQPVHFKKQKQQRNNVQNEPTNHELVERIHPQYPQLLKAHFTYQLEDICHQQHSASPTCSTTSSSRSLSSIRSSSLSSTSSSTSRRRRRKNSRLYRKRPEKAYCRLLKDNTTFHGIRDSIQTAGWLRALWICIIVLASMAALVGCGLIVWEFNTRPLSVTYSIKENVSLILPDIVICPFNRFNRTFLQSLNVSDQLAQYLELAFPQSSQHPFQYKSYKLLLDSIDELEMELAELLESVGLSFAEFIKQSAIDCRAFFVNKSLCDTAEELMTMAGKCFRILGEEQRNDGHGHAQRIIVRLPTKLYNPAPNQMMNDGILVKLAERGKGIDHDMSFVPAGVHAIFPLTATRFEFKHYPPHFLCREEEDPTYSRVWCFEECFLDKAEKACNCSLAAAAQPGTLNICTPRQFFNCVYGVLRFDDAAVVDEQVAECKSHCLPPCKNWRFDKTVTYANFPSEVARHFVKDEAKWDELRNTIILEVFYTTLDYTVIEQILTITPVSFLAQLGGNHQNKGIPHLISQLGGQISLWIGGSIISVMQLVIYLFSYFCVYFRRTRATENNASTNEGAKRMKNEKRNKKSKKQTNEKRIHRRPSSSTIEFPPELHLDNREEMAGEVECVTVRV